MDNMDIMDNMDSMDTMDKIQLSMMSMMPILSTRSMLSICCLFILFSLTSCGYRMGNSSVLESYSTISVPYIEGDKNGELTAEVIKTLSSSSTLEFVHCGGRLVLKIKVVDFRDNNIGYRYDRNKDGQLIDQIIPAETRLGAIVELVVLDSATGCTVLGPAKIVASTDYDQEYYSARNGINIFSLGQVNDSYEARDAAFRPLNRVLAQKIVDFLNNSW